MTLYRPHAAPSNERVYTSRYIGRSADGTGAELPVFRAYERVLENPSAAEVFVDLLKDAHPAGQMYALRGLHRLGHSAFETASEKLRRSDAKFYAAMGCLRMRWTVGEYVERTYFREEPTHEEIAEELQAEVAEELGKSGAAHSASLGYHPLHE